MQINWKMRRLYIKIADDIQNYNKLFANEKFLSDVNFKNNFTLKNVS